MLEETEGENAVTNHGKHLLSMTQRVAQVKSTPLEEGRDYSWSFPMSFATKLSDISETMLLHVDDTLPHT